MFLSVKTMEVVMQQHVNCGKMAKTHKTSWTQTISDRSSVWASLNICEVSNSIIIKNRRLWFLLFELWHISYIGN